MLRRILIKNLVKLSLMIIVCSDLVELLLNYKPDLNIVGESQFTALMMAEAYSDTITGKNIFDIIKKHIQNLG